MHGSNCRGFIPPTYTRRGAIHCTFVCTTTSGAGTRAMAIGTISILPTVSMPSPADRFRKFFRKRGTVYYVGVEQKRTSLNTDSRQLAKEKLRKLESVLFRTTTIRSLSNPPRQYPGKVPVPSQGPDERPERAESGHHLRGTFGPVSPSLRLRLLPESTFIGAPVRLWKYRVPAQSMTRPPIFIVFLSRQ